MAALEIKKQQDAPVTEKEKCRTYYQSIIALWGAAFVVFIMCFIGKISLEDIGFRQIRFNYGFWFTAVTLALSGLFLANGLYNLIFSLVSAKFRKTEAKKTPGVEMLPRSKKEKWIFSFVALSAGVCEEIVFRGFLLFLILSIFPNIPIYLIVLIPSALFGIWHLYQGLKGVIGTAILGALCVCLYLVTDSLILVMLLHFCTDLVATFLVSEGDSQ